jgi:hypothetical protein
MAYTIFLCRLSSRYSAVPSAAFKVDELMPGAAGYPSTEKSPEFPFCPLPPRTMSDYPAVQRLLAAQRLKAFR